MVAQITEKAYFLRSELSAIREVSRRMPANVARIPAKVSGIPNGGFDAGVVGWDIADAATTTRAVVSGALRIVAGSGAGRVNSPKIKLIVGAKYKLQLETTEKASSMDSFAHLGSTPGGNQYAANLTTGAPIGLSSVSFYSAWPDFWLQLGAVTGKTVSYDNISLWEVDPSDNAPWIRLPFGQRVGKLGLINRDGFPLMASDYEEITRAGQSFIKPIVAPGVNTGFDVYCGIGA